MSLPEITMPDAPAEQVPSPSPSPPPSPVPSEVRSESVNYDASHVDTTKLESMVGEITMPPPPVPEPVPQVPSPVPLRVHPVDEDIFKDVKPKKAKSQKQLDHLKRAREKALIVRQANAKLKKDAKEQAALKQQDTRPPQQTPKESVLLHLSVAELQTMTEEASNKAVEAYDIKRKAAKKVKRDAQEEYAKANRVNQQINKALGVPDPDDFFSVCFQ